MSTTPAQASVAAPASEPAAAAPAVPVVETSQPSEIPASGDGLPMDVGAIDAFFRGEKGIEVPASAIEGEAAPEPTVTQVQVSKPPEGVKPLETEIAPGEPEKILPGKIQTKYIDDDGQRALALQHSLNKNGEVKKGDPGFVTLKVAFEQLEGHDIAVASKGAKAPEPSIVEAVQSKVTSAKEKLVTLRAERSAMAQDERFHDHDLDEKTVEIEDAIREVTLEEMRLERATEVEAGRTAATRQQVDDADKAARAKALDTATKEFPGLRDTNTPIGAEAARLYQELAKPGHPDHALLHATNAAGFLAERAARNIAGKMVADGQAKTYAEAYASLTAPVAAPAAVPDNPIPPKVLPVGGAKTTVQPGGQQQQYTEAEILQASMDNPELADKVLYGDRRPQWVIGGAG